MYKYDGLMGRAFTIWAGWGDAKYTITPRTAFSCLIAPAVACSNPELDRSEEYSARQFELILHNQSQFIASSRASILQCKLWHMKLHAHLSPLTVLKIQSLLPNPR
jgi:hypothetical protein